MDTTGSVSKGCFAFKGKKKRIRAEDYLPEDKVGGAKKCHEGFVDMWEELDTEVQVLQADLNSKIFDDLLKFASDSHNAFSNPGRSKVVSKEIPTAALVTGVNTPDHGVMFSNMVAMLQERITPLVATLKAKDCQNVKNILGKTLGQLLDNPNLEVDDEDEEEINSKKLPLTLSTLAKWYRNKFVTAPSSPKKRKSSDGQATFIDKLPPVIVVFEDFESFQPKVVQDFVTIASNFLEELPLVFVFGIATSVSAVHRLLPNEVSSLLCMEKFQAPPSSEYLTLVINQLLMTPKFPFKLGGKVFQLLLDIFLYHDFSVLNFNKGLRFAMMDHYFTQPLSFLCCPRENVSDTVDKMNKNSVEKLRQLSSFMRYVERCPTEEQPDLLLNDKFTKDRIKVLVSGIHKYHDCFFPVLRCLHVLVSKLPSYPLGKQLREVYSCALESNIFDTEAYKQAIDLLKIMSADDLRALITQCIVPIKESSKILKSMATDIEKYLQRFDTLDEVVEDDDSEEEKQASLPSRTSLHHLRQQLQDISKRKKKLSPYEKLRLEVVDYLDTHFSSSLEPRPKKGMILEPRFGWAKLPGCPYWPVKIIKREQLECQVYVESDNAILRVKSKDFVPYCNRADFKTKKEDGIAALKRRKKYLCLEAFISDTAWMQNEINHENETETERPASQSSDTTLLPTEDTPTEGTTLLPTEDTPIEDTTLLPTEDTPTEDTTLLPIEDMPIEDTTLLPTEDTPTEDTTLLPTEDMPIEDTTLLPTEDTPTEDPTLLPMEDMPIEDTTLLSTEDTPTEDKTLLPTEDTAMEDTNLLPTEGTPTEDTPTEDKTLLPTGDASMEDTTLLPTEDTPTEEKNLLPMEGTSPLPTFEPCENFVPDSCSEDDCTSSIFDFAGSSFVATKLQVVNSCSEDDEESPLFTARKLTSYGENDHFEDHEYYHSDDRQESDDLEDPDYVESEGDEVDEDVTLGEFVNEITENKCKELNRPTPSSSSHESVIEMNLARPLGHDIKEEDKLRDKEFKEIYVKKYKILYEGKKAMKKDSRPYDTVHSCKFCNGLFTHIQDHMDNKHGHKPQVKEIIEMKKKLKELQDNTLQKKIRSLQCLLRYEGDHIHNKKVVHYKEGELLVQRKACGKEIFAHHHYGPCPKCFLWLHIDRSLQAHQKNCIGHVNSGTVEFGRSKRP